MEISMREIFQWFSSHFSVLLRMYFSCRTKQSIWGYTLTYYVMDVVITLKNGCAGKVELSKK